jgi:hypothetical protein
MVLVVVVFAFSPEDISEYVDRPCRQRSNVKDLLDMEYRLGLGLGFMHDIDPNLKAMVVVVVLMLVVHELTKNYKKKKQLLTLLLNLYQHL